MKELRFKLVIGFSIILMIMGMITVVQLIVGLLSHHSMQIIFK